MKHSPLLSLHEAAGARLTPAEAGRALLTYGDVPGEYRAAMEGCVVFDEATRGRVAATGDDSATFLHRILANDVRGLEPGAGCRNLLLTGKGKILQELDLLPVAGGYHLDTAPGQAQRLLEQLDVYLFADAVELADESESTAPLALCGPQAGALLERVLGTAPPTDEYAPVEAKLGGAPLRCVRLPVAGSPGWQVDGGPDLAVPLWEACRTAGAVPAGIIVRDILRVEAGQALFGVDIDDGIYPQEARLESAFSLDKGCYIGQEVVAKIDTYGGLNKRLCALRIDHDDPVLAGTRLARDVDGEWRDLGVVTSWAYSFVLDTGVVLAYLKRRHQEPGSTFRVGDGPAEATVVSLPIRAGTVPVADGGTSS